MLGRADSWKITLFYGAAHFGKSLFWYSSELLFAFFLTEFAGLTPAQMGLVLVSGFLLSAIIDLVVGLSLQRWLQNASTASRLQVVGAVLSAMALTATFVVAWLPFEQRFAVAIALGIAFRFAFATYDIPQNALMSLATVDRETRLRVASTRIWFSGAATLLVAASVGPMVAQTGASSGPKFLLMLSLAFSCVAIIAAAALSAQLTAHARTGQGLSAAIPRTPWHPSRVFWLMVVISAITTAFTPAFAKLEAYFAAYTLQSAWWGGTIIVAMALGIVVGQPAWVKLARAHSSARVIALGAGVQIAGLAAFWLAGGAMPPVSAVAAFVFGLGNGGVGTVQWHAFSDVVAREAPHRAGLAYGMFAGVGKLGFAGGAAVIAISLDAGEYRDPTSGLILNLMILLPACGALALFLIAAGLKDHTRTGRSDNNA